jgi:carboxypeptidase D
MKDIQDTAKNCGYYDYMSKYLKYPPLGPLPLPGHSTESDDGCDLWTTIFNAALIINPAFNMYKIFDTVFLDIKPF